LDLRLDADLPNLSCNIAEINQVLMNMIVNSAQAIEERTQSGSPEPGRIVIETSVSENVVCIAIRDNGAGIPEEMETQIYDPEFTTKPPGKGTGLGLAIVKDIIENKHHGSVELQSEVGIGTTFRIKLPIEGGESDFGVHCFGSLFNGQDRPCDE
jgi:signal transduction histidine kinase